MAQRRILLVENEPVLAEITSFRLELMGYVADHAATPEGVFAAIEANRPDLIMVDLLLAGDEGLHLADRLASDSRTAGIPVMAISSRADLDSVQRAFQAGVKEYLVIPYDPVVLEEKLERLVPLTS